MIVDSITDGNDQQYFLVYFESTEDFSPVIYFYKMIAAPTDTSGSGYFKCLSDTFQEDGIEFYAYLQNHLYGFAAEASAEMMDRVNGLVAYIRNELAANEVYAVHFMPHKLHNTLTKAFQTNYFFHEFEDWINGVLELIASDVNAMNNIHRMWFLLVTDLNGISSDDTLDSKTRYKAKDLCQKLKGKNFLLIFNFILDILKHLDFWSRIMQEKVTLLIEFGDIGNKMLETLEALKTKQGK